MASKRNIKVSTVVYNKLEAEKQDGESFDETLRRLLGLESEHADVEDLAAYLSDELRERAHQLVEFIEGLADFEVEVERDASDGYDHLRFVAPDSGLTIARIRFGEEWVMTDYRDRNGEMEEISSFASGNDEDLGLNLNIEESWEEIKEEHRKKINGAYRKWGEDVQSE